MVHNLDPFVWQIYGDFGIRWYGLSYLMGFIVGYGILLWLTKNKKTLLTVNQIGDLVTYVAFGTLIGGRLGYCLFYDPSLFIKFKSSFPFWGVLAVNEGGMASHGGMIGIVVACWLFARRSGVNLVHLFDLVCIGGPIGVFFGRIANFINGELVGRVCPPDFPLAVKFPQDMFSWANGNVEKLTAMKSVVSMVGVTESQWTEWVYKSHVDPVARQAIINSMYQVLESIQNGHKEIEAAIAPILDPRYPSQIFSAVGEGLFVFLMLFLIWRKPRKPGIVAAWFIVLYSMVRIIDEQFRMPDAHIGFQLFGLTRGQWLSIVMFCVGLGFMFIWGRSPGIAIGGWMKGENLKLKKY